MPMLLPGTRGWTQLDQLARASEGTTNLPVARRATQIVRRQDQAAPEQTVIKWTRAAGAKGRVYTICSRCWWDRCRPGAHISSAPVGWNSTGYSSIRFSSLAIREVFTP